MPVTRSNESINELSSVIGELRNFAGQQVSTNSHMLEELKKISDRMASLGELSAVFAEYRKTLHERFGKIHEQMADIDERLEEHEKHVSDMMLQVGAWKSNIKFGAAIFYVATTFTSAILSTYGAAIIRAITH